MNETEVLKRLEHAKQIDSELPDLELKTASNNIPNDVWKSISAFSHHRGGGIIIFGVKENPIEVVGCRDIKAMQRKLIEYFNDKMSYVLRPKYHVISYDDEKTILAVYVPECPKEYWPCYYKHVGLPHGAYMREGNTNRSLTDNEFRTFVARSKQFQFDLTEAADVERKDLSNEKIKFLLNKMEKDRKRGATEDADEELLQNMGILGIFDGVKKPTIAGFLIFAKWVPQNRYPYERYAIRCVRYAGNDSSSDIIDKADATGTLDEQIEDSYKFI